MQQRNLDFDTPMTREQWEMLAQRAGALGSDRGFQYTADEPEAIRVLATADDAPPAWSRHLTPGSSYGRSEREVARFLWNGGRPMAQLAAFAAPDEPDITEQREREIEEEIGRWVRNRWHALMRESGLHYVRGRVPVPGESPDVERAGPERTA